MTARGSNAPPEMQNATRKRLFESLQSPLECFTRLHCWNKLPNLQVFWKFATDGCSHCHYPSGFCSTEATGLYKAHTRAGRTSSKAASCLHVNQLRRVEAQTRNYGHKAMGQSLPTPLFSHGRSQWQSTPISRNSDQRYRSKVSLSRHLRSISTTSYKSCDSSSNGETKITPPKKDVAHPEIKDPSEESVLDVVPVMTNTIGDQAAEAGQETDTSSEEIPVTDLHGSEPCSPLNSEESSVENEQSDLDMEELSKLASSFSSTADSKPKADQTEANTVESNGDGTFALTTEKPPVVDLEGVGDEHSGSSSSEENDCGDALDSATLLEKEQPVASMDEACSEKAKNMKESPGDSTNEVDAAPPQQKKRKRKKPKILQEDIKSNTLGLYGETVLPPEKLRVDTRDSILKSRALQESEQELNNAGEATSAQDLQNEIEVEVVNGTPPPVLDRKHEPVLLLMIGCQGSGKSKFSLDLVQYGAITWARINQDTLRGPSTRGLREECVRKARQLLGLGYCIVVDRMNFSEEQRAGFLDLAKELGLTAHAVVFKLPFQDNVFNVANRTDHEGGFQGSTRSHRAIIRNTRSRLFFCDGLPKQRDGWFDTIVHCESNEHYAAAFRQWVNYGRPLISGQTLTMELWRRMVNEKSRVASSRARGHLYRPLQPVTPEMKEAAVGYVPGRDGPLLEDSSEEEGEESDD